MSLVPGFGYSSHDIMSEVQIGAAGNVSQLGLGFELWLMCELDEKLRFEQEKAARSPEQSSEVG